MSIKISFDIDEKALVSVFREGLKNGTAEIDASFPCPNCGKPIAIKGLSNRCQCGHLLEVELKEPLI